MTPVGQPYCAAGPISFRSVISTVILGTFTAIVSAAAIWFWESSPIPTLVILTPFLQGLLIGLVMAFAIGRLRMRNPKLLLLIGFTCGLASVAMVHMGHHIRFVQEVAALYRQQVEADGSLTPEQKKEALEVADKEPQAITDAFLLQKTGHSGLIGSILLRSEQGVKIKSATLTGWGLWTLWGFEALVVAFMAAAMSHARASEPFCEDCGDWCHKQTAPLVFPGEAAGALAEAVRSDDLASVANLRDHPPETTGLTFAGTILYACGGCNLTFADVWQRFDTVKKGKTESTTKTLVQQISISPEMTALLCNQALAPTEDGAIEEGAEGDVEEPVGE
jgi:hypothetical protein